MYTYSYLLCIMYCNVMAIINTKAGDVHLFLSSVHHVCHVMVIINTKAGDVHLFLSSVHHALSCNGYHQY
jgi:hypothetical protein